MTNCPNCGAPYADSPVCEYCGTAREGLDDDFERVVYRKVSCGRDIHTGEVYWQTLKEGYVI